MSASSTTTSVGEVDPFDRAYFYPDAESASSDALISVCAGSGGGVPGAPEPAALPRDRSQSVAIVTQTGLHSGDRANLKWSVTDDNISEEADGWTPKSIRQLKVSVPHLGYIVCVAQTEVTFQGTCGKYTVVKSGVRVSVRQARSGTELEAFDVAPDNPTGCGSPGESERWSPEWDAFSDRVMEVVQR